MTRGAMQRWRRRRRERCGGGHTGRRHWSWNTVVCGRCMCCGRGVRAVCWRVRPRRRVTRRRGSGLSCWTVGVELRGRMRHSPPARAPTLDWWAADAMDNVRAKAGTAAAPFLIAVLLVHPVRLQHFWKACFPGRLLDFGRLPHRPCTEQSHAIAHTSVRTTHYDAASAAGEDQESHRLQVAVLVSAADELWLRRRPYGARAGRGASNGRHPVGIVRFLAVREPDTVHSCGLHMSACGAP